VPQRRLRSVREYRSFEDMLRDFGVENLLPGVSDLKQAVDIYRSFPGYAEKEMMLGVVAMEIVLPGSCATLGV